MNNGYFRKSDVIIYLLLIAFFSGVYIYLFAQNTREPQKAEIYIDGKLKYVYSLSENREIDIVSRFGKEKVIIKDKKVYVGEADCPDKICVKQGEIKNSGDIIICVPGRMSIRLSGGTDEIDGVLK